MVKDLILDGMIVADEGAVGGRVVNEIDNLFVGSGDQDKEVYRMRGYKLDQPDLKLYITSLSDFT